MVLVVDAHEIIASSLAIALRHSGFPRVATADPDSVSPNGQTPLVQLVPGDIVLVGLLYGDGRTTLPLIRLLAQHGCRVMVMDSDQALPLAGECLDRGAEAVLDKAMSFDRLVAALRRLIAGGYAMTDEERTALLESVERHDAAERALHKPFKALTEREARCSPPSSLERPPSRSPTARTSPSPRRAGTSNGCCPNWASAASEKL